MSENNEGQQMPEVGHTPRVARSASSQPLIGEDQVQAHEGASSPASGGVKVREKRRGGAPRARRMSLSLTRIDAWSAAKVAFMLSIAGGIIQIVAVAILWGMLNMVGVFDQVTQIVSSTGLDCRRIRPDERFLTEHRAEHRHHLLHCGSGADHCACGDSHAAVQRGEHPRRRCPRHTRR